MLRVLGFSKSLLAALLVFLAFLTSFSNVEAALITMGETTAFSDGDSGNGNSLIAQNATLSEAATLQSMSFHVRTAAGNLRLGVYDATGSGGGPGALKAQTNSFAPVVGWNTMPVITPILLPAGNYWIVYFPSSNSLSFSTDFDSTGSYRDANLTFGPMPATFPAADADSGIHWSLYATLDTNTTPDTTPPSVPTNLAATPISTTQINLAWTASTDDIAVSGYNVVRDGTPIATTTSPSFSNTGLTANTTYTYAVRAFDAAGNYSALSVGVPATTPPPPPPDTTPPSTPTNLSATPVSSTQINLAWTASTDNVAVTGYNVFRDGAPIATTTSPSFSNTGLTANTSYTYAVRAFDAAGNYSALTAGVSTTTLAAPANPPPTVNITAPANGASVRGSVTLTATASDNTGVTGVQFVLDGVTNIGAQDTSSPYSRSWSTTGVSNGPHTVSARATDTQGGTATSTINIIVDNLAPPAGTISINDGASATNSRNVTLYLSATDAHSPITQMRFSNSGSSFSGTRAYTATTSWQMSSGAGTKTVYVQFKDAAGNWSPSASDIIVFETTAPTISNRTATNITGSSATITWTTNEAADSQVEYGPTTAYGSMTLLDPSLLTGHSVLVSGLNSSMLYNYRVKSRDAAGNLTTSANSTFTTLAVTDTTPPTVSVTAPSQGATVSGTLSVTASASDSSGIGGVRFFLDSLLLNTEDTIAPYSTSWNTMFTPNGVHVLEAFARDNAGNVATSSPVSVTVSNSPQFAILQPSIGAVLSGTTTVNVAYTYGGDFSVVNHAHFKLDTNPTVMDLSLDGAYSFSNVVAGSHTLLGWLVREDHTKIDGTDATTTFTTTLPDTTPPTTELTAPAASSTVSGIVTVAATASDDEAVAGVQFLLDGANLGIEDTLAPYALTWNTAPVLNGTHTLSARARDFGGNIATSSPVVVDVQNLNPNDPAMIGQWSAVMNNWPLVAVHMTLLSTGKVLMWDEHTDESGAAVWDPANPTQFQSVPYNNANLFCSGHTGLANGNTFVAGGHQANFVGLKSSVIFDQFAQSWTAKPNMFEARWYPTATELPDGRVLVISGAINCTDCYDDEAPHNGISKVPEVYDPVVNNWTQLSGATLNVPMYPHTFVLPNGKAFIGSTETEPVVSRTLDIQTQTWEVVDPVKYDGGSAVMYEPGKIMKSGMGWSADYDDKPATSTTYVIDMNQQNAVWRKTQSMNFPRTQHNLVLLPDGTTLAIGGGRDSNSSNVANAVYEAELWSPSTETWSVMAAMAKPRMYHGTALLMPDGRVLVAGYGRFGSASLDQENGEFYSPPYLFKGPRPTITSAPDTLTYNSSFTITTSDSANISRVSLVKLGSVTHAFNSEQRFIDVPFTQVAGGLELQAPLNGAVATPGYYMLFIMDGNGVPSVAKMVHFPSP